MLLFRNLIPLSFDNPDLDNYPGFSECIIPRITFVGEKFGISAFKMPSIDVAMARSLRGGVWGSVMSSMAATIEKRQIMSTVENVGNQVNDVKTAFSSWDNCMSVNYCK